MSRVLALACLLLPAGTALAERHVVQRGETLEHVAQAHGCTVDAVLRANDLRTTLVPAGTVVEVPACTLKMRAQTRSAARSTRAPTPSPTSSDDDKARAALAVIDGASWIASEAHDAPDALDAPPRSLGEPWHGALAHGEKLATGDGYVVRRPSRAYGAPHVVEHLRHAIAEVRARYPGLHTLAIGDLSAEHGGKISEHRSHQSGLDVDVGFYFTRVPDGYPAGFAAAGATLDLEATWALLAAFARTSELPTGAEIIFLDHAVQKRLYDWAKAQGTPDEDLAFLFQYPRGKDEQAGLVRHWPNHANHFHVRFKPRR